MRRDDILRDLQTRFSLQIKELVDKSSKRVYIQIDPSAIRAMSSYLLKDLGARFNIASGIDERTHMEILYHYTLEDLNLIITLLVKLSKEKLAIDSLATLFEGANWIEREIHEILGIDFIGHPDLRRLLLPEGWPEGVYPLRRDYKEWDPNAVRTRGA